MPTLVWGAELFLNTTVMFSNLQLHETTRSTERSAEKNVAVFEDGLEGRRLSSLSVTFTWFLADLDFLPVLTQDRSLQAPLA